MTDFRIGHGYDVHALADGLRLVLGGIEIPHTKGCVAHSDGDVAIHAVCDALLGAAALGDIGLHFPDTSDDFARTGIRNRECRLYDPDAAAQAPAPYRRDARRNGRCNGRRR